MLFCRLNLIRLRLPLTPILRLSLLITSHGAAQRTLAPQKSVVVIFALVQHRGRWIYLTANCFCNSSSGTPLVSGTIVFTHTSCRHIIAAKNENT